ncbi:hypothetical protein B484DRAFT_164061 [Ochromonadaceae sp. CCMP2298]|nr:hypothetical protein B484DRAFT_164061 [Ochromonadaceae sp. CCMP2298]
MLQDSDELMRHFADHCSRQSAVVGRHKAMRGVGTGAVAVVGAGVGAGTVAAIVAGTVAEVEAGAGTVGALATAVPATAAGAAAAVGDWKQSYNWSGLLLRTFLGQGERGFKVRAHERLHDVGILLERCKKRLKAFDPTSVASIYEILQSLILNQASKEAQALEIQCKSYMQYYAERGMNIPPGGRNLVHSVLGLGRKEPQAQIVIPGFDRPRKTGGGVKKVRRVKQEDDSEEEGFERAPRVRSGGAPSGPDIDIPAHELSTMLCDAWEDLSRIPGFQDFTYKITDDICPAYSKRIRTPMDLGNMLGTVTT